MKEGFVNRQRSVVADYQPAEVPDPGEGTFHDPSPLVAPQSPTVLRRRFTSILAMRRDQFGAAGSQLLAQRVAIIAAVADDTRQLLPRPAGSMPSPYPDGRERRLDELASDGEAE